MLISTICSISYPKTWGEIIQLEDQLQRPGRSRGRRPPRPPNSPGEGGWQKKMPTPMEFSRGKNGNIVKQLKKPVENRFYSIFLPGIMTQLKPHDMGPCLVIANQTNSSHLSMAGWSYPFKGALAIIFSGCSHCLASKSRKSFGQTQENQRRTPFSVSATACSWHGFAAFCAPWDGLVPKRGALGFLPRTGREMIV